MIYGQFEATGSIWNQMYIWTPNPFVNMTPDEQYAHNKKVDPKFLVIKVVKPAIRMVVA